MSQSTALLPMPLYAPVRTGNRAVFDFGDTTRGPLRRVSLPPMVVLEADEGTAYGRNGRLVAPAHIGTHVNLYA